MAGGSMYLSSGGKLHQVAKGGSVTKTTTTVRTGKRFRFKRKNKKIVRGLNKALNGYVSKSPFPPMKSYKLRYEQDGSLTVGASGVLGTEQVWNLNSLYDPDSTGAGHQPYGYDALAVAYNRYKVHGVLVDLLLYNCQTIDVIEAAYMVTNPSNSDSLTGADADAVGERQMGGVLVLQDTGSQRRRVKFYLPMHIAFGTTKIQFKADLDNTTAGTGGNPGSIPKFRLAVADPNGGSSGALRYKMKLTYYAQMYQRDVQAQS